jgi:glycosyltransferase involved in cell wall biosynthesis
MPKIAIFYDWLNQWGGAEKVLLDLIQIYPDAPIYTLVHEPKNTPWLPPNTKVITSSLQKYPKSKHNPIFYTPFYDFVLEQFDFSQFDIVISTTSVLGHCFLTQPKTLYITYFHNINRHLYSKPYLKFYQNIDKIYSIRPDHILCNSQTVAQRILNTYNRHSTIINPGIDTTFFTPATKPTNNYFLIVGRLVAHKKVDITIDACGQLGINLKIVGVGRDLSYLKLFSKKYKTITFLGNVNDQQLKELYQNCQALICPQVEDFGLTPLEAQACGKPIIAFKAGGITETVIENKTGIFFKFQTVSSLKKTINKFFKLKFSPQTCRQQSLKFSREKFMLNFEKTIQDLWQKHQTII